MITYSKSTTAKTTTTTKQVFSYLCVSQSQKIPHFDSKKRQSISQWIIIKIAFRRIQAKRVKTTMRWHKQRRQNNRATKAIKQKFIAAMLLIGYYYLSSSESRWTCQFQLNSGIAKMVSAFKNLLNHHTH